MVVRALLMESSEPETRGIEPKRVKMVISGALFWVSVAVVDIVDDGGGDGGGARRGAS